jgi:hypothetical protein
MSGELLPELPELLRSFSVRADKHEAGRILNNLANVSCYRIYARI